MGDFIRRAPQFSLEMFHAFRDERPKEEKWELIDGVPMMMPPPTLTHQRICKNLESLLDNHLRVVNPAWMADREIGILLPHDKKFNPEPDVTVIDTDIGVGQIYAERFYFVAEVLSDSNRPELVAGSDKPIVLAAKLAYYREHALCQAVLFVRQDCIEATLYARPQHFEPRILKNPADRLDIPGIGDIGSLVQLYRHTPLWPAQSGV